MKRDDMITIRVSKKEKKDVSELAAKEGHNTVSGFMMWLMRQYKEGKLRRSK
jgi:uncharacterized protein (DUF1778 family)